MFRKDDIDKYRQRERLRAETYLNSYVDFVKWTTALGLAATVWLANAVQSQVSFSLGFTILGLLFIASALILAVLALKTVLNASAHEWDMARLHHSLALLDLFKALDASEEFVEKKREELTDRFQKLTDIGDNFYDTKLFNRLLTWHVGALIGGVSFYAAGQLAYVVCGS